MARPVELELQHTKGPMSARAEAGAQVTLMHYFSMVQIFEKKCIM
jgi:hypothetical protein